MASAAEKDQEVTETLTIVRAVSEAVNSLEHSKLLEEPDEIEGSMQRPSQVCGTESTLITNSGNEYLYEDASVLHGPSPQVEAVLKDKRVIEEDPEKCARENCSDEKLDGNDKVATGVIGTVALARQFMSSTTTEVAPPDLETQLLNESGDEHHHVTTNKNITKVDYSANVSGVEEVTGAKQSTTDKAIVTDNTLIAVIQAADVNHLLKLSSGGEILTNIDSRSDYNTQYATTPAIPEIDNGAASETARKIPAAILTTASVPPHLRAAFQTPVQPQVGLRTPRHSDLPPAVSPRNQRNQHFEPPRFPRSQQPQFQPPHARYDAGDREQVARLHAQILSLKNVLEAERRTSANMRKTIEVDQQRKSDAAFSSMLGSLMREQEEALVIKARAEAKMRDLEHCEKKIEQMEVFLTEGQKQLFFKLDQEGIRPMSTIDREQIKREAELSIEKKFADAYGKLQMRTERVGLRESAQKIREQQYKVSVRAALQAEAREAAQSPEDVDEIAELEYNRGYAAGKEVGLKAAVKPVQKDNFIEGYAAYHRAQTALDNFRHGRIAQDSPELAFLFDTGHPDNFVARGMQMGSMSINISTAAASTNSARHETSNDAVNKRVSQANNVITGSPKRIVHDVSTATNDNGRDATNNGEAFRKMVNGTTSNPPDPVQDAPEAASPALESKPTEHTRKMPPLRPTFAAELRGATPTHNGSYILANASASPGPESAATTKIGRFAHVGPDLLDL